MDDDVALAMAHCLRSLGYYLLSYMQSAKKYRIEKKKKTRRRCWMKSAYIDRTIDGMENIFTEANCEESGEFINFCGMSQSDFEFLLKKIEPMITKQTRIRTPISAKIRLAVTLRYLATGDSYRRMHDIYKISIPVISLTIPDVCKAINIVLQDQIKSPKNSEEWLEVEEGFRSEFPRCVGVIDKKHIVIKCPAQKSSEQINHKGTYTIDLVTLVDNDCKFICADIGDQRNISDGGIFQHSSLWRKIDNDIIDLPPPTPLPGREMNVPYVFVGDRAFASYENIMKPFPGDHDIDTAEQTFNRKLSNTLGIVENAFGALTSNFKIFKKPIEIDLQKVPHVIMSCILLHNFLRNSSASRNIYTPPGLLDSMVDGKHVDGTWRQDMDRSTSAIMSIHSKRTSNISEIQYEFANYFHYSNL